MIKKIILFSFLFSLISCTQRPKTFVHNGIEISEDYILVEFASKLEEDYHRLNLENENLKVEDNHHHSH